jgi:outer membrane lipoprotein LolB
VKRLALLAATLALLAGCASPVKTALPPDAQVWAGRMALSVEGARNQSFSAGFELKGAPQAGELTLFNPLGGTVGVLAWAPGSATLRSGNDVRQFASLDELSTEVTGAAIPVTALFDWLGGKPTEVPGWQVDLSDLGQGRLRAQRTSPPPPADLRLALER